MRKLILIPLLLISLFSGLTFGQNLAANTPESSKPQLPNSNLHTPETAPFLIGGVQMNEGDTQNWVETVANSGMNTVEVTVYAHQGRWNDNNLWYPDVDAGTVEEIRLAKASGLKVVLILRLQLDHYFPENKFLWHGMVFPETWYLLNRWFESYGQYVRAWSKMAEAENVDMVVLGSEMNALFATRITYDIPNLEAYFLSRIQQNIYQRKVLRHGAERLTSEFLTLYNQPGFQELEAYLLARRECKKRWAEQVSCADSTKRLEAINYRRYAINEYWKRLIWDVRKNYSGKLTVAANFDNYQEVGFWSELDCIGINAYFPLRKVSDRPEEFEEVFYKNWCKVLDEINAFREAEGLSALPVIFTELGYTEYSGSTLAPWAGSGFSLVEEPGRDSLIIWDQQPVDHSEREKAVFALQKAVRDKNFPLSGILYWKFTTQAHQLKEDPFALHIGAASEDKLQGLLLGFMEGDQ